MKNLFAFLLCLIVILSLFSCKPSEDQDAFLQNESTDNSTPAQAPEAEKAMQMYESAIKGDICVFDERAGETSLKSLRFTSNGLSLGEINFLKKAVQDIDGDGVNEYVIRSLDDKHILLRCYPIIILTSVIFIISMQTEPFIGMILPRQAGWSADLVRSFLTEKR